MSEADCGSGSYINSDGTTPRQIALIHDIKHEEVVRKFSLGNLSTAIRSSVKEGKWGEVDGGIVLESRSISALSRSITGGVYIFDLDDTLISSSGWHKREYRLLSEIEAFSQSGIRISVEQAREIYEQSKMLIPGVADKEPRYTPRLNMILASKYARIIEDGLPKEQTEAEAWSKLMLYRETIDYQVQRLGESVLDDYIINPAIEEAFMGNSPSRFLYTDFVQSVLDTTGENDVRVIATRGKIEGPLGQIHKVHGSGLLKQESIGGQRIDLVLYFSDLKTKALITLTEILSGVNDRLLKVYDDNPSEVLPYLVAVRELGASNIDIVQVSHPDAKRSNAVLGIKPSLDYMHGTTRLRHYSSASGIYQNPQVGIS